MVKGIIMNFLEDRDVGMFYYSTNSISQLTKEMNYRTGINGHIDTETEFDTLPIM